jgi:sugar (pentulose or hexulose) kinase
MIVWLDKRECSGSPDFPKKSRAAFKAIGLLESLEIQWRCAACNWIMENEPDIWDRTYKFLMLPGYINLKLTGNMIDSTANQIGHVPFNSKKKQWADEADLSRCVFNIPMDKLVDLNDPGDVTGKITAQASYDTGIKEGLDLIATGSDKGCETLGLSVTKPGKASVAFGTTATIQIATDTYVEPIPFMPAYPAVVPTMWNPEIQIYRGYWLISWFKKEFGQKEVEQAAKLGCSPEELLNSRLKEIPAGSDGLIIQPYFTPGVVMPKAKGSMIGFSDVHTRIHIYRAIIEGLNYALMDGMYDLEKRSKTDIKEIYLGGGGSQSAEICQITANMFGVPCYRIQTYEACALGSSIVAFVSKGFYKNYDDAVEGMVHIKDEFIPDIAEHKFYYNLYKEIFKKIMGRLDPLYDKYGHYYRHKDDKKKK